MITKSFFFKLAVSLLIGGFFLSWVFNAVDLHELKKMKSNVDLSFIFIGLVFYFMSMQMRVIRWHKLLFPFASLTYGQVSRALVAGYAMNVILPARLGELFRVNLCKKWYSLSRSTALATIVWERVADGITVVACLIVGALSLRNLREQSEILGLIGGSAVLFSSAVFVLFILRRISLEKALRRFPKLQARLSFFQKGIQEIPLSSIFHLMATSILVWIFEGLTLWSVVMASGISLDLSKTFLLTGVVSLSTLLPSPPGFLGTLQFAFGIVLVSSGYSVAHGILAATLEQMFILSSLVLVGSSLLVWGSFKKPILTESNE